MPAKKVHIAKFSCYCNKSTTSDSSVTAFITVEVTLGSAVCQNKAGTMGALMVNTIFIALEKCHFIIVSYTRTADTSVTTKDHF